MTYQSPSATTAGRWQLLDPFLLQARSQFGLPPALGSIPFVARTQLFVEGAEVLASAGRDDGGAPHGNTHDRRIRWRLHAHFLIVGVHNPPQSVTLLELH